MRRSFIKGCLSGGLILFLADQKLFAAKKTSQKKLLNIILPGGWDTALAVDPVTNAKMTSGNYEAIYRNRFGLHQVNGKSNLVVGEGLMDALPAFEKLPTCFVNGIFMEVSAHEIALNYMLSGVRSLSRSREYPSLAALAGSSNDFYPPHLVLGKMPPLGNTRASSPPLQSQNVSLLASMLKGPGSEWVKETNITVANELIKNLDSIGNSRLSAAQKNALSPWEKASKGVEALYARNLSSLVSYTPEIKERYLNSEDWQGPGTVAGAFLALKSGLCPYVTVTFAGEFDSHSNHIARHLPSLQQFAKTLSLLAEDLARTPDPDDATKTLAQTTLVVINSEFSRTPKFNAAAGTDHWQSSSAILMGAGVNDNTVLGATGLDAKSLGWISGTATTLSLNTALLPEHLVSAILASFGLTSSAYGLSTAPLQGAFV